MTKFIITQVSKNLNSCSTLYDFIISTYVLPTLNKSRKASYVLLNGILQSYRPKAIDDCLIGHGKHWL